MSIRLPVYAYVALIPLSIALALLLLLRLFLRNVVLCRSHERLDGKTVIITGGSSGIGHAVSVDLAKRGARVVLACRDRARRDSAPFSVRSRSGNVNVRFMYLDLSSLDSIVEFCHQFCETEQRLDILINNAAVLAPKDWTMDGLDQMMGVNYIGHYLLSNLLLEKMKTTSNNPRIINITCDAVRIGKLDLDDSDFLPFNDKNYDMYRAYSSSKLALLIITKEMAIRFRKEGISVFAVNPGVVDTKLLRNWPGKLGDLYRGVARLVYMSPEDGAQSIIHCSLSRELDMETGKCISECKIVEPAVFSRIDTLFGEKLWNKTEALLKGKNFDLVLKNEDDE